MLWSASAAQLLWVSYRGSASFLTSNIFCSKQDQLLSSVPLQICFYSRALWFPSSVVWIWTALPLWTAFCLRTSAQFKRSWQHLMNSFCGQHCRSALWTASVKNILCGQLCVTASVTRFCDHKTAALHKRTQIWTASVVITSVKRIDRTALWISKWAALCDLPLSYTQTWTNLCTTASSFCCCLIWIEALCGTAYDHNSCGLLYLIFWSFRNLTITCCIFFRKIITWLLWLTSGQKVQALSDQLWIFTFCFIFKWQQPQIDTPLIKH